MRPACCLDPATNKVIAEVRVEPQSFAATFGVGAVWTTHTGTANATRPRHVQRIDPVGPSAGSGAVRVAGGNVWLTAPDANAIWVLRP
jgi:hypothetical protein